MRKAHAAEQLKILAQIKADAEIQNEKDARMMESPIAEAKNASDTETDDVTEATEAETNATEGDEKDDDDDAEVEEEDEEDEDEDEKGEEKEAKEDPEQNEEKEESPRSEEKSYASEEKSHGEVFHEYSRTNIRGSGIELVETKLFPENELPDPDSGWVATGAITNGDEETEKNEG